MLLCIHHGMAFMPTQVSGMASMRLELAAATAAKEEMKAQLVTSRAEVEALRAQLDAVKR